MVTIEITGAEKPCSLKEVEAEVGVNRLRRRGTDDGWFVDYRDRESADLVVINLNCIPGVKARICGG